MELFLVQLPQFAIRFPRGEYSNTITLATTDDNIPEHDGRISATIIPSPTYDIVTGEASDGVQVVDNDAPMPRISITKARKLC